MNRKRIGDDKGSLIQPTIQICPRCFGDGTTDYDTNCVICNGKGMIHDTYTARKKKMNGKRTDDDSWAGKRVKPRDGTSNGTALGEPVSDRHGEYWLAILWDSIEEPRLQRLSDLELTE